MDIFFKLLEVKHIDRKGLELYVYSLVNTHKLINWIHLCPDQETTLPMSQKPLCASSIHCSHKGTGLLTSNAIDLLCLFELYENGIIQNVFFLVSLPSFAHHILFVRFIHMVTFYCIFNVQRKLVHISRSYMTAKPLLATEVSILI